MMYRMPDKVRHLPRACGHFGVVGRGNISQYDPDGIRSVIAPAGMLSRVSRQ
jgi:hypothetical protein